MATRKPLVLINGLVSQLPAGDSLEGAGAGTGDVTGPSSSVDKQIAVASGSTGKAIQFVPVTVDPATGTMVFPSGARIQGDFSNSTVASRTAFQTNAANNNTNVEVIPNGTATASILFLESSSDPTNSTHLQLQGAAAAANIIAGSRGTGSAIPLDFYTGGVKGLTLATDGAFTATRAAFGYGVGAGGTVTQATSKATAVTLNKPNGAITTAADALAANTEISFAVNNSFVVTGDGIQVNNSSSGNYTVRAGRSAGGVFNIFVKNTTAGSLSEAITIDFKVIKGSTT